MGLHRHLPENEMCCAAHHSKAPCFISTHSFLMVFLMAPMPTWAKCTQIKNKGTTLMNNYYFLSHLITF